MVTNNVGDMSCQSLAALVHQDEPRKSYDRQTQIVSMRSWRATQARHTTLYVILWSPTYKLPQFRHAESLRLN